MAGYVYLLHGSDTFSRDEQVRALKDKMRALPAGEHNLSDYRGLDTTAAEVLEACGSAPFLADRRMVIAQGLLAKPAGSTGRRKKAAIAVGPTATLLEELPQLPETTALVLVEEIIDKSVLDEIRKSVPKERLVERSFGQRDDLAGWVRQRVKAGGGSIEPDAVRALLRACQDEIAILANEVDKLLSYANDRPISASDVDEVVVLNGELSAFALLDALADGDRGTALRVYRQQLHQGERPEAILPQIAGYVRRLTIIRAAIDEHASLAEAAAATQINPRTVDRLATQARRLTAEQLREAYTLLLDADLQLKTSGRVPAVAVELVIAQFPTGERTPSRAAPVATGRRRSY
jgi:DNA polymerase-3 subunit delta